MTIDISNLSQEKRAFLKANPDLLKSFDEAASQQAQKLQKTQKKQHQGKSKLQRELEDIDGRLRDAKQKNATMRQEHIDPHLRRIQQDLMTKLKVEAGPNTLVCPVCGEPNGAYTEGGKPNEQHGKPWCLKCDSPLIPKRKVKRWLKMFPTVKRAVSNFEDEFKRRRLDF